MPRLPPVEKFFQTRLRRTFSPGVGYSVVTLLQSHSSSSATICARPVSVPCPISERAMRTTTVSSGRITTHALTSGEPSAARTTFGPNGTLKPSARPPATEAELTMNSRRESFLVLSMAFSSGLRLRSGVDRFAHLLEGPAATDVGDRCVDVGIGRIRLLCQERGCGHDHSRLAVAALRHVVLEPRLLDPVERAFLRQAFDRHDALAFDLRHRRRARADRLAVDVHGARAALRDAAAVFRSGQSDLLTQHPKERRGCIDLDIRGLAIESKAGHRRAPL